MKIFLTQNMKNLFFLSVILLFSACNVGNDIIDDYVEPKIIIENASELPTELIILQEHQFVANFFNDVGTKKNELIVWESSDNSILSINSNGLAIAKTEGTVIIKVSAKNDNPNAENTTIVKEVATIKVVTIPEVLTITNSVDFLIENEEFVFTSQYFNNAGIEDNTVDLEWISSDPSIATINNNGKVTAIKIGETNITVKTLNNSVTSESFLLKVKENVSIIRIENPLDNLKIGNTHQYEYTYFDEKGDENTSNTINWESSDSSIASISNTGLITAIKPGSITVTASTIENGTTLTTTTDLNIVNNTLTINAISSIDIDETHQYIAGYDGTSTITWESSNNSIATITTSGFARGISEGSVIITATTIEGGITIKDTVALEVNGEPKKTGTLSGSYSLAGTVVLTSTNLAFTNFVSTAPDTHIYLTNNPSSITNGLKVSVNNVTTNASFSLALDNININDYSYVVVVCQGAGNLVFGSAELN